MNKQIIAQTETPEKNMPWFELRALLAKHDFRLHEDDHNVMLDYGALRSVLVFGSGTNTGEILKEAMKYLERGK
jgi:hypothetical protein